MQDIEKVLVRHYLNNRKLYVVHSDNQIQPVVYVPRKPDGQDPKPWVAFGTVIRFENGRIHVEESPTRVCIVCGDRLPADRGREDAKFPSMDQCTECAVGEIKFELEVFLQ